MEFNENRPDQPFIGYILLARSLKRMWQRRKHRRALPQGRDESPETEIKRENNQE